MWQSPNQRTNAAQVSKRLREERLSRPIHLQRVRAEVRLVPPSEVHADAGVENTAGESPPPTHIAHIVLNDLSASGIGIHAAEPMIVGLGIKITLTDPAPITVEGKVIWSQDMQPTSRVITNNNCRYRIGVKFNFATPEEEAAFKTFCDELQTKHLYAPKT